MITHMISDKWKEDLFKDTMLAGGALCAYVIYKYAHGKSSVNKVSPKDIVRNSPYVRKLVTNDPVWLSNTKNFLKKAGRFVKYLSCAMIARDILDGISDVNKFVIESSARVPASDLQFLDTAIYRARGPLINLYLDLDTLSLLYNLAKAQKIERLATYLEQIYISSVSKTSDLNSAAITVSIADSEMVAEILTNASLEAKDMADSNVGNVISFFILGKLVDRLPLKTYLTSLKWLYLIIMDK